MHFVTQSAGIRTVFLTDLEHATVLPSFPLPLSFLPFFPLTPPLLLSSMQVSSGGHASGGVTGSAHDGGEEGAPQVPPSFGHGSEEAGQFFRGPLPPSSY